MLNSILNLVLAIMLFYGVAYGIGFVYALFKHRAEIKEEAIKLKSKL
jgi:hypothetical protein